MVTTIGILSIGEMGLGVAQLLQFHGYRIVTNVSDRSKATQSRAKAHSIESIDNDNALVEECDYILSIVPPRDALTTAQRMKTASSGFEKKKLHFLDLNAVSPISSEEIFRELADSPNIILYDGVISGGIPHPLKPSSSVDPNTTITTTNTGEATNWHCPTLLMSGPNRFPDAELSRILNIEHMSDKIGAAVSVKMCFGMLTKGYIALAIQSFTTAHRLDVLDELESFLGRYKPAHLKLAQEGLVRMPHTAYRWVYEMLEMAGTVEEYGGFDRKLFEGVAESYRLVAEDTILATELPDARVRGQTVEDVVICISEGIGQKRKQANDK